MRKKDGMGVSMNLRLADMSDLPKIKAVYRKIIENMDRDNVQIWDEIIHVSVSSPISRGTAYTF